HHQRHFQADFFHGGDDAFRDDVALHDAAEDVDQNALNLRVGRNDLERRRYLFGRGTATDVKEVGRLRAIQLDDIQRGHSQASAIDHAADFAIKRDVGQVELGGFD